MHAPRHVRSLACASLVCAHLRGARSFARRTLLSALSQVHASSALISVDYSNFFNAYKQAFCSFLEQSVDFEPENFYI